MHPNDPKTAHIAESQVMGRAAVAVTVAYMQPTAVLQLLGSAQASQSLDALGVPYLATAWAITMIVGGVAMLASFLARDPADTRVVEIVTNGALAGVAAVHGLAVFAEVGWSGSSYVVALDAALLTNCGGRSYFLARQIWFVSRRSRRAARKGRA